LDKAVDGLLIRSTHKSAGSATHMGQTGEESSRHHSTRQTRRRRAGTYAHEEVDEEKHAYEGRVGISEENCEQKKTQAQQQDSGTRLGIGPVDQTPDVAMPLLARCDRHGLKLS